MRIYLAARFTDRPHMETIANHLKSVGFAITSGWVFGGEDGLTREQIAVMDIEHVDACDTLVLFTHPYGSLHKGGGRHAEFGYAMAKGKRLIVVGDRENVFHHHPTVQVFPDINAWLHHLNVAAI